MVFGGLGHQDQPTTHFQETRSCLAWPPSSASPKSTLFLNMFVFWDLVPQASQNPLGKKTLWDPFESRWSRDLISFRESGDRSLDFISAPRDRYLRLRAKTGQHRPTTNQTRPKRCPKPAHIGPTPVQNHPKPAKNQNLRFRVDISVVGADILDFSRRAVRSDMVRT